jgi:hypothetical protein
MMCDKKGVGMAYILEWNNNFIDYKDGAVVNPDKIIVRLLAKYTNVEPWAYDMAGRVEVGRGMEIILTPDGVYYTYARGLK